MSKPYQNQHYVSQVLLRRFTNGGFLQRYHIQSNTWKRVSPKRVFSGLGYTQLLAYGEKDDSLEQSFKTIEDTFPVTLNALENAANTSSSVLTPNVYDNLSWYCAFLWRISPFAKAKAPVDFVKQLDVELHNNKSELLEGVGIKESVTKTIQQLHKKGFKVILRGEDYLQVVWRIQCVRQCREDYCWFRHFVRWTVCKTPVELPISDIALVQYFDKALKTTFYFLPLSPNIILIGTIETGTHHRSNDTIIKGNSLRAEEAEYCLDAICLSAVNALACKSRIHDIAALRERAIGRVHFVKIKNIESVISAGMRPFKGPLIVSPVTMEEYVTYTKCFIEN
jgi:hypothetical protein